MVRAWATGCRDGASAGAPRGGTRRVALLAALAVACASDPPNSVIAPGHEGAPGVAHILVAPLNLVLALRPELESGVEPVQAGIAAYLARHGREVERIPLLDARRLWEASVAELSGSGSALDFPSAIARFTRELALGRDFQALVLPSLLLQKVVVRHRGARWDGVDRRIRLVNRPRSGGGRSTNVLVDGLAMGSLNAVVEVSSLHLLVFDREGRRVFEGRGGIEFVQQVDLAQATESFSFDIAPRDDLFEDAASLSEAIEVAFTPYLRPPSQR